MSLLLSAGVMVSCGDDATTEIIEHNNPNHVQLSKENVKLNADNTVATVSFNGVPTTGVSYKLFANGTSYDVSGSGTAFTATIPNLVPGKTYNCQVYTYSQTGELVGMSMPVALNVPKLKGPAAPVLTGVTFATPYNKASKDGVIYGDTLTLTEDMEYAFADIKINKADGKEVIDENGFFVLEEPITFSKWNDVVKPEEKEDPVMLTGLISAPVAIRIKATETVAAGEWTIIEIPYAPKYTAKDLVKDGSSFTFNFTTKDDVNYLLTFEKKGSYICTVAKANGVDALQLKSGAKVTASGDVVTMTAETVKIIVDTKANTYQVIDTANEAKLNALTVLGVDNTNSKKTVDVDIFEQLKEKK